jgi:hypothetical protein
MLNKKPLQVMFIHLYFNKNIMLVFTNTLVRIWTMPFRIHFGGKKIHFNRVYYFQQ